MGKGIDFLRRLLIMTNLKNQADNFCIDIFYFRAAQGIIRDRHQGRSRQDGI